MSKALNSGPHNHGDGVSQHQGKADGYNEHGDDAGVPGSEMVAIEDTPW